MDAMLVVVVQGRKERQKERGKARQVVCWQHSPQGLESGSTAAPLPRMVITSVHCLDQAQLSPRPLLEYI